MQQTLATLLRGWHSLRRATGGADVPRPGGKDLAAIERAQYLLAGAKDECFFHGHEPIPDGCYTVCGECWHAYVTEEELLEADAVAAEQVGAPPAAKASEVTFCPLCLHDLY
jgi:hypothetical protein